MIADQVLRRAVHDLADSAQGTPDLALIAITKGRRIRRRRRMVGWFAAVAALAAMAAPFVWLRPDPGPQFVGPPEPTAAGTGAPTPSATGAPTTDWMSAPLTLPGGWIVTGATSTGTPAQGFALDRTHGRYVDVSTKYTEVWTAPRGNVAAVFDYDRPQETGLLDVTTGDVRWIRTGQHIMTPQWSPDGTRLALTILDKASAKLSLGILGTGGTFRTYPVDTDRYFCSDYCFFTWRPDGREVVLQQTDLSKPRSESAPHPRRGLQLFSAVDGKPTRLVPVRGDAGGPDAWSPDGRLVVVKGQKGPQLVEVASGRVVRDFPAADVHWISADRLLYIDKDGGAAVLADPQGKQIEQRLLPAELAFLTISVARG